MQTDVELKLRLAGIPVLSHEQWLAAPGHPYLYVNVNVLDPSDSAWPYSVMVELDQSVKLERSPEVSVVAATWSAAPGVGNVGSLNVRSVRDHVKDQVDHFINAYLAVNPKN